MYLNEHSVHIQVVSLSVTRTWPLEPANLPVTKLLSIKYKVETLERRQKRGAGCEMNQRQSGGGVSPDTPRQNNQSPSLHTQSGLSGLDFVAAQLLVLWKIHLNTSLNYNYTVSSGTKHVNMGLNFCLTCNKSLNTLSISKSC